jgi:hypothetical protein
VTVIDTTEYRLTRQVRSASAAATRSKSRKSKSAVPNVVYLFVWRRVSPSAHLMVDPRSGARAVIRDIRSKAGRFHWSVMAAGEMYPVSEGRTDDVAQAQSVAGAALREYAEHVAVASAREREGIT